MLSVVKNEHFVSLFSAGSSLFKPLTLAVLQLQDNAFLADLKEKWWKTDPYKLVCKVYDPT